MADDMTKQEILFYTIIAMNPAGIREDEIFLGMGYVAEEIGWPAYLNTVPRALEERLRDQEYGDNIKLCAPLTWQPQSGEHLKAYIGHLIGEYLKGDENKKAREVLGEKLGMDFAELQKAPRFSVTQSGPPVFNM